MCSAEAIEGVERRSRDHTRSRRRERAGSLVWAEPIEGADRLGLEHRVVAHLEHRGQDLVPALWDGC